MMDYIFDLRNKLRESGYNTVVMVPTQTITNADVYILLDTIRTLGNVLDKYKIEMRLALFLAFQAVDELDYFQKVEQVYNTLRGFTRNYNSQGVGYFVEGLRFIENQGYVIDVVFEIVKRE